MSTLFAFSTKASTTKDSPDFAFPETVAINADTELNKALSNKNYLLAVKALIQSVIANDKASSENAPTQICKIDSIANILPRPYSSITFLLEAELYTDIYSANRWIYNNRTLPIDKFPDSPFDWSKDLFTIKVESLIENVIADETTKSIPLTEIATLLNNTNVNTYNRYPTAFDFIAYRSINLLSNFKHNQAIIPFSLPISTSPSIKSSEMSLNIVDQLIDFHKKDNNQLALAQAHIQKSELTPLSAANYLSTIYQDFKDTQGGNDILIKLNSYKPANDTEYYQLICSAIKSQPNLDSTLKLVDIKNSRSIPSVNFKTNKQYTSASKVNINVTMTNATQCYMLVYKIPDIKESVTKKDLLTISKPTIVKEITTNGEIPFSNQLDIELDNPGYGCYAIVPSTTTTAEGIYQTIALRGDIQTFCISDIAIITSASQNGNLNDAKLYICNALNNSPIENAEVNFSNYRNGKISTIKTEITDKEGAILIGDHYNDKISVSYLKDKILSHYYIWKGDKQYINATYGDILTDLSIYHPGDSIRFSSIVYRQNNNIQKPASDLTIRFNLKDVNYQTVDSITLKSDISGRLIGALKIPTDGLLGKYHIEVARNNTTHSVNNKLYINSASFDVAEYRRPLFFVDIDSIKANCNIGDTILITGKAMTYAGLPVCDASVKYDIRYMPYWRFQNIDNAYYGNTTITDKNGQFNISLPTEGLKNTPYNCGRYILTAYVTSSSGETQQSQNVKFNIGNAYKINCNLNDRIQVIDNKLNIPAYTTDITGNKINKTLNYELTDITTNELVKSGSHATSDFTINAQNIKSGRYKLALSMDSVDTDTVTSIFTLFRDNDTKVPYKTPLWTPQTTIECNKTDEKISVRYGSGYNNSWILCQISDMSGIIERKWLYVNDTDIHTLTINAPENDNRLKIQFYAIRNLELSESTVTITPHSQIAKPKIETISFRNNIIPGNTEKWTFRFSLDGNNLEGIPVMAVMTDKSLNAITPFEWKFNPSTNLYYPLNAKLSCINSTNPINYRYSLGLSTSKSNYNILQPQWDFYNLSLYAYNTVRHTRDFGNVKLMAKAESASIKTDEVAYSNATMEDSLAGNADTVQEADTATRNSEHPVAFFTPDITTNSDGIATISFSVPDFNTTWQFQLLGYDDNMNSAILTADAIASKPIIAESKAPRFLRTSDNVTLSSILYNNTDSTRYVGGKIEIFNPVNKDIILSKSFSNELVLSKRQRTIECNFTVPDTISMIGYRVYATSDSFIDGEQSIICILPSTTPISTSIPFYIDSKENHFETDIPAIPDNAKVSITYCDNPIWLCVTALPDLIEPQSASIFETANALFANCLASNIINKYPIVRQAIAHWSETNDSILNSPLYKQSYMAINNTPWVNDATAETTRMHKLSSLLDSNNVSRVIDELTTRLIDLQLSNGAWSFCPDMKASTWVTAKVVNILAIIKEANALPDNPKLTKSIDKALRYCDYELYSRYITDRHRYSRYEMLHYLYVRSSFNTVIDTPFLTLKKEVINDLNKNWRNLNVFDAATAAILLYREGYYTLSRNILESLKQHSINNSLQTAARELKAFREIDTKTDNCDRLRRWLINQRTSQNWGKSIFTADIISTIINSGTDWTIAEGIYNISIISDSSSEVIYTNNNTKDTAIGTTVIYLNPTTISGKKLSITRNSSTPAYGNIIADYILPNKEIKNNISTPQLSITKQCFIISPDGKALRQDSIIHKGDKVRVTLTIHSSQTADYVVITDNRQASLEPINQLSGCTMSDGVYMYRETRNDCTNLFIERLPAGYHTFSYDCFVAYDGQFAPGSAQIKSLYATELSAATGSDF
jgi:hypothetical protein